MALVGTLLYGNKRHSIDHTVLIEGIITCAATEYTCYDLAVEAPQAVAGVNYAAGGGDGGVLRNQRSPRCETAEGRCAHAGVGRAAARLPLRRLAVVDRLATTTTVCIGSLS